MQFRGCQHWITARTFFSTAKVLFIYCLFVLGFVFVVDTHTHISPTPRRFVSGSNFDMEGFTKTRHHAFFWPVRLCQANREDFWSSPCIKVLRLQCGKRLAPTPQFCFCSCLVSDVLKTERGSQVFFFFKFVLIVFLKGNLTMAGVRRF